MRITGPLPVVNRKHG